MKRKCIPVDSVIIWSAAGYAAYLLALYIWRKPVCQFTEQLCRKANEGK